MMETQKCLFNNVGENNKDLQTELAFLNVDGNTLTLDQANAVLPHPGK